MRGTGSYEYVNALVRGQIGNLLKLYDYEAILGCTRPSDIVHVLSRTTYGQMVARTTPESFADLREAVMSAASKSAESFIASSPDSARIVLEDFRLLLESRSIVNSLKLRFNQNDLVSSSGAIPLGAIPSKYYELPSESQGRGHIETIQDSGLARVIRESLETARRCGCVAPLLRILIYCGERSLDRISEVSSEDLTSTLRPINSMIDAANLEIVLTSIQCGIEPQTVRSWLFSQRGTLDGVIEGALGFRDIVQLLAWLRDSRYGPCLEAKSEETVDDLLNRLPYCLMRREARSVLSGYPFRASTVAAGMMLKLLEIRNLRLAVAGASGGLGRAAALRLMVFP